MVKISLANRIGDVSFLNTTLFVFRLNIINIKTYLFRFFNLFQDNFDYMGCSGGGTMISSCSGGGCCTPCSTSQQQHLQVNNFIDRKTFSISVRYLPQLYFKGRRYDLVLEIMIINLCVKLR